MSRTSTFSALVCKTYGDRLLDTFWGPNRLTVLAYHRIVDCSPPTFDLYRPNVSASPAMFERQMAYVAQHYNVISLDQLSAFLMNDHPLPVRPLLITFDDGYLDNYTNAYPVLRRYNFPAVIFLITDKMDQPSMPWWDACAYYFFHTAKDQVELPILGPRDLSDLAQRNAAREAMIIALKKLSEVEKQETLEKLRTALDIAETVMASPLFVSWNQVRELVANGVACQPHTVTHPIMTRIAPGEQKRQLVDARARIEAETGQTTFAFAYPNGTPDDYDASTMAALRETGYQMAFTLVPGPIRARQAVGKPLEIPRVFMGYKDTLEVAILKMLGLPALIPSR